MQTIAVDLDDVLAESAAGFVKYINDNWGMKLEPDDYTDHWALLWGVNETEAQKRAVQVHKDMAMIVSSYRPNKGAKEALMKLSKGYRLVVVTSRRRAVEKVTRQWLDTNFEGVFDEIQYSGIWEDLSSSLVARLNKTKIESIKKIGTDYLIDDQAKHCFTAAEAGITAILFGDYRWNRDIKLKKNMVGAKNWQEVMEYFDGQK